MNSLPQILMLKTSAFVATERDCDCAETMLRRLRRIEGVAVDEGSPDRLGAFSRCPDLVVLLTDPTAELSRSVLDLRRMWDRTPILGCFCSSTVSSSGVLRSLSAGIDDYLRCPVHELDLVPRIERLLRRRAARRDRARGDQRVGFSLRNLVGESETFLEAVELIPRFSEVEGTLLITGETGTGKELFARAIHYESSRRGKPFVPVNCGALPDHLVENELFGHEKGAYTDASKPTPGLVGESEGGTLFLDEVEALSPAAQAKLLRFLQDHEYRPLGSSKTRHADVRVVAATNVDLKAEVDAQRYREDLFYRLSVLLLRIPPLRDRIEDVPLLAEHFARRYARQQGAPRPRLSSAALARLTSHPWPGNVRELEAVIQRSVLMAHDPTLSDVDIRLDTTEPSRAGEPDDFREAKSRVIESFERTYLARVLTAHSGNVSEAARASGTDRRALQRLMRKHGIDRRVFIA